MPYGVLGDRSSYFELATCNSCVKRDKLSHRAPSSPAGRRFPSPLFGSSARGRARPDSDVDLGILSVDEDLPRHAELELQEGSNAPAVARSISSGSTTLE